VLAELLPYFERELDSLTGLALAFAQRYPKIASRLQVEEGEGEDPHVERLVEAFALLAARIHRRMDDDYPEIIEAFIQILYPQYLQPIPSATVVQLVPLEGGTRSIPPKCRVSAAISAPASTWTCGP
jgi:type VI secretion system protein ImpG